jgi:hypothetical protein
MRGSFSRPARPRTCGSPCSGRRLGLRGILGHNTSVCQTSVCQCNSNAVGESKSEPRAFESDSGRFADVYPGF